MAIQTINLTVPGGDTPRSANTKINANFSNATHAASKLVGERDDNLSLNSKLWFNTHSRFAGTLKGVDFDLNEAIVGDVHLVLNNSVNAPIPKPKSDQLLYYSTTTSPTSPNDYKIEYLVGRNDGTLYTRAKYSSTRGGWNLYYHSNNTTKDSNGFLKGASPVVNLYSDRVELNRDAEKQNVTFEKLGIGDYLVKGSLGFAQEGWYVEMPKDANGNVLVAVVYEQLANNDVSMKTYAKTFDMDTGDVVPNLSRPRDIPEGRFISLRLHEELQDDTPMPTTNLDETNP